ncbi:AAA15 family ATPase/GTPase [Limimaricola soesokkakensis]|uniref:AAA15 family ATPase/GTPase n=1 Tax=Limimaricola soesokkakensis TaxID=1343159 RepID=A0A1X6YW77_9RHOB|nr:ATP-binding protein [Limimaricola soesokkakensis]PSK87665.1 AAA15 family ATPase/GTPase [Limimaricola soesokkakensis]SLN32905.1 recombination protein F [Limimaricola soesokkakensis]
MAPVFIRSIEFKDYKSFAHFKLSARERNVLVGPNNAGKSTVLDAFRIAFDVIRSASKRAPKLKSQGPYGVCSTYFIPHSAVQSELRHCVHNFGSGYAEIIFDASNGSKFVIRISPDDDIESFVASSSEPQKNTRFLEREFGAKFIVIPTLSPLEQNEELVQQVTVERNRYSRLASRNFRNFWLHQSSEDFEKFADLVEMGWPGIRVRKPELEPYAPGKSFVRMFFRDGPHVREIQWAGFGFQVWMQSVMHLLHADKNSIVVLDEPDVYLHPDLQHKLLRYVTKKSGQYFIATHSTEIINDVEPGDVLIVRPTGRSAKRIKGDDGYAEVYNAIGSSENAQFARLARTRKVLYLEGKDARILSKVAGKFLKSDFLNDASITVMKTDGFSNWLRVSTTSWVFNKFFDFEVKVAAIFDRDYRSDLEVADFTAKMRDAEVKCFVLPFKELENILLVPVAIGRVVRKYARDNLPADLESIIQVRLDNAIEACKVSTSARRSGSRISFELERNPKVDVTGLSTEESQSFESSWRDEHGRISVVPGKAVFTEMADYVQKNFKVSLTPSRVVDEISESELPKDFLKTLDQLQVFFSDK